MGRENQREGWIREIHWVWGGGCRIFSSVGCGSRERVKRVQVVVRLAVCTSHLHWEPLDRCGFQCQRRSLASSLTDTNSWVPGSFEFDSMSRFQLTALCFPRISKYRYVASNLHLPVLCVEMPGRGSPISVTTS